MRMWGAYLRPQSAWKSFFLTDIFRTIPTDARTVRPYISSGFHIEKRFDCRDVRFVRPPITIYRKNNIVKRTFVLLYLFSSNNAMKR